MSAPRARLIHRIAGRARLRIASRRGEHAYFHAVGDRLREHPQIRSVRVNGTTASVLIEHEPTLSLEEIAAHARRHGLFDLVALAAEGASAARHVARQLQDLDGALRGFSGGEADVRSVVLLGLLGLSFLQALSGHVLGPASTLLWQAFQLAGGTHLGELAGAPDDDGGDGNGGE